MDHPHIAHVYDAGTTPTGRPYFVMELCRGEPMTEFCDKHNLTIRERLELFIPVCDAVGLKPQHLCPHRVQGGVGDRFGLEPVERLPVQLAIDILIECAHPDVTDPLAFHRRLRSKCQVEFYDTAEHASINACHNPILTETAAAS